MADALIKYDGWVKAYWRIQEKVFPLLMAHVRDAVKEHFEAYLAERSNFEYELKMVDTNIPPYHILFDKQLKRITGIIDFGCAGLGDPFGLESAARLSTIPTELGKDRVAAHTVACN